jgi:hypothetical protein
MSIYNIFKAEIYNTNLIGYIFVGKATISNDGATILKTLDIVHPAAKTLVDIAKSQDAEVRTEPSVLF